MAWYHTNLISVASGLVNHFCINILHISVSSVTFPTCKPLNALPVCVIF